MNYQKIAPEEVLSMFKRKGIKYSALDYYAFPETFGSTTGPSGIGGCTMSTFTVEAYVCDGFGPTIYTCNGKYKFKNDQYKQSWH